MQAIQPRWNLASAYWRANVPFLSACYRNAIIFLGFFGLCALYVMPAKYEYGPLPINVFVPSILVVFGSLSVVGKRVLTITPFDYILFGWFALALLSHIFANEQLFRTISLEDLYTNLEFISTLIVTFRAFFALTCLAPRIASRMFVRCSMLTSGAIVLLGILQKFGPGKQKAITIGMMLTKVPLQVQEGVANGRPTGIYQNPNMLGYVACIFAVVVLGWALADLQNLKPAKTIVFMGLIGFAMFGTMAVQSRENVGLLALMPIICGVLIRRYSVDSRNAVIVAFLVGVGMFGGATFLVQSKSTYLMGTANKGITKDISVQERLDELRMVADVAPDIAPLGTGQSASNLTKGGVVGGYSFYRLPNIDSEWGNIFTGYGIWGPLLILALYFANAKVALEVWRIKIPEARMMGYCGIFLLVFNIILTIAATRVAKFETGLFTFQILGVVSAWRSYGRKGTDLSQVA